MKTATNLTMSEMINFDKEVVHYINNNLPYIKENAAAFGNDDLAKESLEHYNDSAEGFDNNEECLSEEQKKRFYSVAMFFFNMSFFKHVGDA